MNSGQLDKGESSLGKTQINKKRVKGTKGCTQNVPEIFADSDT